MAQIIFRFAVQVFLIIYISINIVHGDVNAEIRCVELIRNAFGNCNIAKECLEYAIKHYVYDSNVANFHMNLQTSTEQSSWQGGVSINHPRFASQSIEQADSNINIQLSDEQIFDGLEVPLNFEGLRDFIESDSYLVDQGFIGQTSRQNDLSNNVQSFNEQSSVQNDPVSIFNNARQYHTALPTINNETDYATHYHKALYEMITGSRVPQRGEFCRDMFYSSKKRHEACLEVLTQFGTSSIAAVRWAFTRYTLAEVQYLQIYFPEYEYITLYMETIIRMCRTNPSKKPIQFCQQIVEKLQREQRN